MSTILNPKISEQNGNFKQILDFPAASYQRCQPSQGFHSQTVCYHDVPQQTFYFFPKLPPELREMIWAYILPGPRLIEVYNGTKFFSPEFHCPVPCENPKGRQFLAANPHRPALFYISRESRRVAWRTFRYCFTIKNAHELPKSACKAHFQGVLFQPSLDTIYFRSENQPSLSNILLNPQLPEIEMSNIKSFAIDDWNLNEGRGGPERFFPFLFSPAPTMLSGLREIFVIRLPLGWAPDPGLERTEDTRWKNWVKSSLTDMKSPLDPQVRIVRKANLWNGENEIPWVSTPYWMSHTVQEIARDNAVRRFASLSERANLPLSALR